MFVFKAAVVGAGTMGGQIAQTIAASGIPVVLKDINQDLVRAGLDEAKNVTSGQVGKLVERGKLTAEQGEAQIAEVLGRIHGTTSYEGFGDVDFVIEAVPERMEIKQSVFAELDAATPGHAILASNTSSLSITEIGEATLRPEKVVGFHYFYPASIMPLIEIVEGEETSAETVSAAVTFAQSIRKQPITCAEVPGFVVNRILNSGISEVWREQEEKGLSIKKIDEGVGAAGVVPIGPYYLVNLLGLDTVLHVAEHLVESYGEERFYVPKGMQKLVANGKLGAKTGGDGFYNAEGEANIDGRERARRGGARGDALPEDLPRGLPRARGGRRHPPRHRLRDDGRRRPRPPSRPAPPLHEGRRRRSRLDPRAHGDSAGALRRALHPADHPAPPRRPGPPRAEERAGLLRLPPARRRAARRVSSKVEVVKLETRADGVAIAWLANGQMNSISPQVIQDLQQVWSKVKGSDVRALVIASSNPFLYCAGADIKAFTTMDESSGAELINGAHSLFKELGEDGDRHDRRRQRPRLRRRLRARDGLRRAHRRALGHLRPARGQAGDHPRLRRHAAPAASGGHQQGPRDEFGGRPHSRRGSLRARPRQPHRRGPRTARHGPACGHASWPRRRPWRSSRSSPSPAPAISRRAIEEEKRAFAEVFLSADAKEGISAFLGKRAPRFQGR